MPLRSGYNLNELDEEKQKWQKKWEQLSDKDKEFYHNTLPFLLLCEDIDHVSKETISIIIKRHSYNPIIDKNAKEILNEKYLSKFIGFEANVETKNDKEFFDKLFKSYRMRDGNNLKNKKAVDTENINYAKEVYKRDISDWYK